MRNIEDQVQVEGTEETVYEYFLSKGWTDGLPVIPPTIERVEAFLAQAKVASGDILGVIPPQWAELTVEKLAVNAIMAGCKPEYMPVLAAAIKGMCDPAFNLYGVQATTNPVGPMLAVNGPVAKRIGLKADTGALGPGWRANVTLGRAIRLVLINVGGGTPGDMDRATQGMPGKLFFCLAENEEASPWEPFHVEKGYPADTSTVTVIGASGSLNLIDQGSLDAEGLLKTFASALSVIGTNNIYFGGDPVLLISPEHADTLSKGGFKKRDVKEHLFNSACTPIEHFSQDNVERVLMKRRPHLFEKGMPGCIRPIDEADDLIVLVVGGPGKHSAFVPTFGVNRSVTRIIS
ncbi:MAG: hypothetical protein HYU46_19780 [Deltaproteobacteria bacterium]|nr:hypothetical protein [Deltaproteobacteria bacterium]MBI2366912.1 hypothetical protein [Deltaproteobacteria bacterium]MBI3065035.1 hypothetical protein [Deltaproteobacteria bacterium]